MVWILVEVEGGRAEAVTVNRSKSLLEKMVREPELGTALRRAVPRCIALQAAPGTAAGAPSQSSPTPRPTGPGWSPGSAAR